MKCLVERPLLTSTCTKNFDDIFNFHKLGKIAKPREQKKYLVSLKHEVALASKAKWQVMFVMTSVPLIILLKRSPNNLLKPISWMRLQLLLGKPGPASLKYSTNSSLGSQSFCSEALRARAFCTPQEKSSSMSFNASVCES